MSTQTNIVSASAAGIATAVVVVVLLRVLLVSTGADPAVEALITAPEFGAALGVLATLGWGFVIKPTTGP